ncbi:MAG: class IV adenylate cyclase [Methanobacterium sp.]
MIEVEVKAHVTSFKDVESNLNVIGAVKSRKEHQIDTYFNNPHYRDFEITDEALRIRKTTFNNGEFRIVLTYKGAKLDDISKTRKEIEVDVENSDKMRSILENLGFKPVADVEKYRTTYLLNQYIITLDTVQNVGKFVEIEKEVKEGEDFKYALDEIFRLYKKLDIEDGFERKSYLELMGIYKDE